MLKAIILGAGYRGRAYAEYATARSWGLSPPQGWGLSPEIDAKPAQSHCNQSAKSALQQSCEARNLHIDNIMPFLIQFAQLPREVSYAQEKVL